MRTPTRSLLIGAVAGLAGSFVMNQFQKAWSRRMEGIERGHGAQSLKHAGGTMDTGLPEDPTTVLAGRVARTITGTQPDDEARERIGTIGHYVLGGGWGALYGLFAHLYPQTSAVLGIPFGAVSWVILDQIAMPLSGLSRPPAEYPARIHAYTFASHLVYGAATEAARRQLENQSLRRSW